MTAKRIVDKSMAPGVFHAMLWDFLLCPVGRAPMRCRQRWSKSFLVIEQDEICFGIEQEQISLGIDQDKICFSIDQDKI